MYAHSQEDKADKCMLDVEKNHQEQRIRCKLVCKEGQYPSVTVVHYTEGAVQTQQTLLPQSLPPDVSGIKNYHVQVRSAPFHFASSSRFHTCTLS